jgi:hypothetical protein
MIMGEPHGDSPGDSAYAKENLLGYVDWFALHDPQLLERALGKLDGVELTGESEWTWYESSSAGRRVVAELAVEGGQLALETYTERDADLCRSRLEISAGSAVEFLIGQESYKTGAPVVPESEPAVVLRDRLQTGITFLTFDERLASAAEREGLSSPALG